MKVAVISDIHGNVPALGTVLEHLERFGPDYVVVNGDTVSRGPRSDECLRLLAAAVGRTDAQWAFTRGNHEDYVVAHQSGSAVDPMVFELRRLSYWTYQQLGPDQTQHIAAWPLIVELPDGLRITHGSMGRNDQGIYPHTTDEEVRAQIAPAPAVFATAHTHVPWIRPVDETLVVNSGSVGMPFDGDRRASYLQLALGPSGWTAEVIRLVYDYEAAERDYVDSGCLDESGALTRLIFREWKTATPLTRAWFREYYHKVLDLEITLDEAVDRYLASV